MTDLAVIAYEDPYKAEEVRTRLRKLEREYLVDLEDAVVAVKDKNGKIKLHQMHNLTATGAVGGGFWGTLIGVIFLNPLLWMAAGAAAGAVVGALSDIGIKDPFMKEIADNLKPNTSVLFVLVRSTTPEKVREELRGTGGTIIHTTLSHEREEKLQEALSAAKSESD